MKRIEVTLFETTSQELLAQFLGFAVCPPSILFLVYNPFSSWAYFFLGLIILFSTFYMIASIGSVESYLNSRWRKLKPREQVKDEVKRIKRNFNDWCDSQRDKGKKHFNDGVWIAFMFLNLVAWGVYAWLGVGFLIVFQIFFIPLFVKAAVVWHPKMKVFGMRNLPDWFWEEIEETERRITNMGNAQIL